MQQLNTFASLKSLSLQSNYLEGFFPIQGMSIFFFLKSEILKFSTSFVFFFCPLNGAELRALENLVMLDLSLNHLTGMQGK